VATRKKTKSTKKAARKKTFANVVPGMGKPVVKGAAAVRFTSHKRRTVWFQERSAWPYREPYVDQLVACRQAMAAAPAAAAQAAWQEMGPTNIGGRSTCLVSDPGNADILWLGSAGGGVWKSVDGGRNWRSLWHKQDSLNVGSLAIERASKTLYCGTGEANLSADSYPGVGIYRSRDGGDTWDLWAPAAQFGLPRRIGAIAIDPFDPNHIRIGGVRHRDSLPAGMFFTRDGGLSWRSESAFSANPYLCHDIKFHPTRRGVIFATIDVRGFRNGIWRSSDGGGTWTQLLQGLPNPTLFDRASLAIAPSRPDVIYAQVAGRDDGVLGIFVSANMGNTWRSIGGLHFRRERQMAYGNTIVVHPARHRHVLCGGVDLHLTTDGGASWQKVTRWNARRGRDTDYAHADHHALLMPTAAPGRVYDANDGGMDASEDGGRVWVNRSKDLASMMYYDLDVAASNQNSYGGGTQDNGTNVTINGSANDHFEVLGGDGGWMVYDPANENRLFASMYNFFIARFDPVNGWVDVSPPASDEEKNIWMCFITLDPNQSSTVFTGSLRVWRSKNNANSWSAVSPVLDDSFISAIEVAPANSNVVFAGTTKGGIFRSVDGGNTWSGNIAGPSVPDRIITRIETHPGDARRLTVTVGGSGGPHVFHSTDQGVTWSDIDGGRLPDVPHHAAVIPSDNPGVLYVSNDAGVYRTADNGANWENINGDLPNTMVVDLVHHVSEGALYAATYGRGIWKLSLG